MAKQRKAAKQGTRNGIGERATEPLGVRIIGGRFRGRKLQYDGDMRTRPMKDRVREALFNLLGTSVIGKVAIDLFAGTGALGLEAISRGALRAVFFEQHLPTCRTIRDNAKSLEIDRLIDIVPGNTFLWAQRFQVPVPEPWVVFCSPPYDLYVDRHDDMMVIMTQLIRNAPLTSQFVVEADERFDFSVLPKNEEWDIREYHPAFVGIWEKAVDWAT